ncbi:hypothetical protein BH09MYX1_BH09MYX1_31330 [soil metagenome]
MVADSTKARSFSFEPAPAVAASRARSRYVDCSVCGEDKAEYLFHRTGIRFVRCSGCALVYVSPVGPAGANYFDLEALPQYAADVDRACLVESFGKLLEAVIDRFQKKEGRAPRRTVLLGRWLEDYRELPSARAAGLEIAPIHDAAFVDLVEGTNLDFLRAALRDVPDVVILDELLEATAAPAAVLELLRDVLPDTTWIVVNYANAQSLPARALRRYWPRFFDHKRAYFSTNNICALFARFGYSLQAQLPAPVRVTPRYTIERLSSSLPSVAVAAGAAPVHIPLRTGGRIAMFRHARVAAVAEKLSIVFPVFNEARYVAQVVEAILAKPLPIDRELIIVESNSTDGTRDVVKKFEGRPGVKLLLEDKPRGKGHAVRTGLQAVTGSIILIQDADFEYDINDYDALLAPLLQRRTSFVLGSRSLGLDDWKVRRFEGTPAKRFILNAAQVGFAKTFNLLYQQRTTDVNTMYKVFRTECLDGIDLESDRFSLDIELVCKLVKNGFSPLEVPVNYVARGFEEGKKISFLRDAIPSYAAFFKYRFSD